MGKRNKIRYQSEEKVRIEIVLTGKVMLQYRDSEEMLQAVKGDLLVYAYNDALNTTRCGEYDATGFVGYFKLDVFDGKDWKPVLSNTVFSDNQQHFSKKDKPIDTFFMFEDMLKGLQGRSVVRTYREHYTLEEE
jgi:hypothetical protein